MVKFSTLPVAFTAQKMQLATGASANGPAPGATCVDAMNLHVNCRSHNLLPEENRSDLAGSATLYKTTFTVPEPEHADWHQQTRNALVTGFGIPAFSSIRMYN